MDVEMTHPSRRPIDVEEGEPSPATAGGIENVVMIYDFAHVNGGAAKIAIDEAIGLSKLGINVVFFAPVGPVDETLAKSGVEVVCLGQKEILHENFARAGVQGIYNHAAVARLKELLERKRFPAKSTVVHVHGWSKALSPFIFSIPERFGLKIVTTLHDFFLTCPNGGFLIYPTSTVCPLRPLSMSCLACNCDPRTYTHKLWRFARTWLQNHVANVLQKTRTLLVVSEFQRPLVARDLPPEREIVVLENPIQCEREAPCDPSESGEYLFVGRFAREKGVLLFAQAAGEAGVKAVFVGTGDMEVEVRHASPGGRFLGWLSSQGVREQMRRARALVFPSLWYEAAPIVFLEAMALGIPVICSDVCAATAVVRHEQTGLHFKSGSVESLRDAILRLQDAATAREFGRRSYEAFWAEDRTIQNHLAKLLRIYEETLLGATTFSRTGRGPATRWAAATDLHD